jgi:hypothetical protein
MLMHHVAAASLLLIMCFGNLLSIGCTIAYLHDIADIFASVVKAFSQTEYTKITAAWMICVMIVWGYTRNYLLPKYIYFLITEMFDCYPA